MWTLVMILYTTGLGGAIHSNTIGGFASEGECLKAVSRIVKILKPNRISAGFTCVYRENQ